MGSELEVTFDDCFCGYCNKPLGEDDERYYTEEGERLCKDCYSDYREAVYTIEYDEEQFQ